MAKKKFEQELESIDALRSSGGSAAALDGLRKALRNRNNYLVAKAARVAGQEGLNALVPDLLAAIGRFYEDPVKSDPQCWAKNAITKALADLGHDDPDIYLRGLRHVQMEPVWGGSEDTAGALRGQCAVALVSCRSLRDMALLAHLVEPLVDADKTVRIEAARAIGRVGHPEAALLLRLRALTGDAEPEVTGACLSALLAVEGDGAVDFVSRFLDRNDEVAGEAALAIAFLRNARALELVKKRWARERDATLSAVLLTAIALTQLPEAVEFLIRLCETGSPAAANSALEALASARVSDDVRSRIRTVAQQSPALSAAFDKYFQR